MLESASVPPGGREGAVALIEAATRHGGEVAVAAGRLGEEWRWQFAGERVFPAASTIKLVLLVACFREIDAGRLGLDRVVSIEPGAMVGGSGVLAWLHPGLRLPLADLAYLMVAVSDNTASNLLLDAVGFARVRETAAALGLTGTALNRRFLGRAPGAGEPENLTTARDLATLLTAIAQDRAASPASCAKMRDLLALQQDRDRLARRLPPEVAFAGKSGSLPGLVHDAGLLTAPGGTFAVAVLTRGLADSYAAHELIGRVALALLAEIGGG